MAYHDDHWVRLFNVSDPRRAYAGHTLYKVTSKVFQKEFPEGATEITVWRRFSDFKKLHQELFKIFTFKHFNEEEFPHFPKAKFFGRFEEGVIEERRKAALELLNFAGNITNLFTSMPFLKFFEGGFPDSPKHSDSLASIEDSSSETEGDSPQEASSINEHKISDCNVQIEQQSPSPPISSGKDNDDSPDEATLGGVWLLKQPSLTEGLDTLSSDEEDENNPLAVESSLSHEGTNLNPVEEHDDVFHNDEHFSERETGISAGEERESSTEPPKWLVRAISICSEGEDLEILASEADIGEDVSSFPNYYHHGEGDCQYHSQPGFSDEKSNSEHGVSIEKSSTYVCKGDKDYANTLKQEHLALKPKPALTSQKSDAFKGSLEDPNLVSATEDEQSFSSASGLVKGTTRQRTISDLGNIYIDSKESDYLYAAGHTIHQALDHEVNGRYEEAFSLYKSCVGVLLSGVQGEKDAKRREAVRRQTAKYLLKAEALYNTYLACKESSEKSEQDSLSSHPDNSLCESNDLHKLKDLTLVDLKVIGVVGKVILVQNTLNGETCVVKAVCKSGPTRTHVQSYGNGRQRKKSARRLYGKYPNIVRLYKFFETANTIYLLLEYAQGGRLWDHIFTCHRSYKESLDYVTGKPTQRNVQDRNKLDGDHSERKTNENHGTTYENSLPPKVSGMPEERENHFSDQVSVDVSMPGFAKQGKSTIVCNTDTDKWVPDGSGTSKINTESVEDKCTERSSVSPDRSHLLFMRMDKYFASSMQLVPNEHIKIWAAELVLAVAYLHTAGIICRDLNPRNVLLDEEGHILLTYFGSWEEADYVPDEEAMNHLYCAPEIWQLSEVTAAADWWSVGALLYEIITGQALSSAHPWGLKTHTELQLPNRISPEAKSLIKELLRVMPSERLGSGVNGVEEIKTHPFFSGVNWAWLCSRIS
ncbi:ribosomal protein S6 kinase-like 1 isoform X2 [Montipora foliosa]|uniref:ribosomal protein S6 kinase-like 1 isoform X2 n=1 Tax=Montipora foliosa TaxID=591990 RepID=UPI0035F1FAC7